MEFKVEIKKGKITACVKSQQEGVCNEMNETWGKYIKGKQLAYT